jgi:HD-like signal output (HDOD) protein
MLGWLRGRVDPKKKLERILAGYELPTFPASTLEALRLLRDPKAQPGLVAERIEADPHTSARLLGLANSSAFGLRREVASVNHAVSLLGRATVESLLLGVAAASTVGRAKSAVLRPERFWRTATERAMIARDLAKRLHPATESESFTAALLQDMALPLLAQNYPGYDDLLARAGNDEGTLIALERQTLPFDHAHVAGWLCQAWSFPSSLTDAIGAHHEDVGAPLAVAMVARFEGTDDERGCASLVDALVETTDVSALQAHRILQSAADGARSLAHQLAA